MRQNDDFVAQLVEQLTLNQWAEGSSPSEVTENKEADRKVKYSVSFLFCILLPSFSFFLYAALSSLIFFKGVPIFCINT